MSDLALAALLFKRKLLCAELRKVGAEIARLKGLDRRRLNHKRVQADPARHAAMLARRRALRTQEER